MKQIFGITVSGQVRSHRDNDFFFFLIFSINAYQSAVKSSLALYLHNMFSNRPILYNVKYVQPIALYKWSSMKEHTRFKRKNYGLQKIYNAVSAVRFFKIVFFLDFTTQSYPNVYLFFLLDKNITHHLNAFEILGQINVS